MKLAYLRYFARLASVLNYTKAAKELYIAQPTLSSAIKRMEHEIGFKLFNRTDGAAASVELTAEGEIFLENITDSLESYDRGLRLAKRAQKDREQTLNLGTLYSMKGTAWSQAIDSYLETCEAPPTINMVQAYSPNLVHKLKEAQIDVAFSAYTPEAKDVSLTPVWAQQLVVCVHQGHPLASYESVSLDDLAGQRVLTYSMGSVVADDLLRLMEDDNHGIELVHSFDDELAMAAFVAGSTQHVALMAYSFLVAAFNDVVCIPVREVPHDFHTIYLMCRNEKHSPIVGGFIDYMSQYSFPEIVPKTID